LPPLTLLERRSLDYSGLDAAMAFADEAMRKARRLFAGLPRGHHADESAGGQADSMPEVAGEDSAAAALPLQSADG
jgi:hypothetical protein